MLNCLKKKQKRTKNPLFLCKLIKKWKFFLQYSTIYGNIIMYTGDVLGKKELKMKEEIRKTQLKNNVESILYGYENGIPNNKKEQMSIFDFIDQEERLQ